jgi:CubicO group peptidase (beta-lactamase class C family)
MKTAIRNPHLTPIRRRVVMLLLGTLVSACIGIVTGTATAQAPPYRDTTEIPATPAYQRALELVELINADDAARIRAYVNEAFAPEFLAAAPLEEHVRTLRGFYWDSAGFDVHAARSYEPARPETDAVLIVRNRTTEGWQAFVLSVEPSPPHRIVAAELLPARLPSDLPPAARLDEAGVARELGAYVDRLAARDRFSGTLLLAKDGRVLLTKAHGLANRDFRAPINLDTRFNLGSMNKMLTAVAVAQLAEQGMLDFTDPISRYLDASWLPQEILDAVSVEQLLTHTSGLGSHFNDVYDRSSRLLFRQVDDYKPLVRGDTLAFAPGSSWRYSNTGFLLLGAIVEKASGQDYFAYIREHVTGPAGMTSTDCYELDRVNESLAVGYERQQGPAGITWRNNIFDHVLRGGPAGGGYSTVGDLLRFDQALRAGRLLKPEMLARVWRAYPEHNSPGYGYGFGIQTTPAGRWVGHSGGFTGISAYLGMYLDEGYTVAVLSNESEGASPVHERARQLIEQGR